MAPLRDSIMVPDLLALSPRKEHHYYDPASELYAGLWSLFAAATVFLALRVWVKINRRHGLWYDDYLLILSWVSTAGRINRLETLRLTTRRVHHSRSFYWGLIFSSLLNTPLGTQRGAGTTACIVSNFRIQSKQITGVLLVFQVKIVSAFTR